MEGKYFQEFEPGESYVSPWRFVSDSDIRRFTDLTGMREPLFDSQQFIEDETDLETWIAPGFLTLSFALGLFMRSGWLHRTGLALLEIEKISFEEPVPVGSEIRAIVETTETMPTSSARGGVVTLDWNVENQDRDTVVTMESKHFIKKRD